MRMVDTMNREVERFLKAMDEKITKCEGELYFVEKELEKFLRKKEGLEQNIRDCKEGISNMELAIQINDESEDDE